jgi:hypothetical protein
MSIAVYETFDGWFVQAKHPIGPFMTKEWAVGVAEGMVYAIRSTGEDAKLVVEEGRTWAPPGEAALRRCEARSPDAPRRDRSPVASPAASTPPGAG